MPLQTAGPADITFLGAYSHYITVSSPSGGSGGLSSTSFSAFSTRRASGQPPLTPRRAGCSSKRNLTSRTVDNACIARAGDRSTCEPTTHRAVRRVFLPPPHHLHECRPEPTLATPNGGGSRLHRALEASPGSRARPRWSGSVARLSQPICEVFRVPMGTDPRTQPAEEREQTSAQAPSTAITSATNLHDAVSVRCGESCTMRCRKKLYDALSVRTGRMNAALFIEFLTHC